MYFYVHFCVSVGFQIVLPTASLKVFNIFDVVGHFSSPSTVGHGQSEGDRMIVSDFHVYVRDSLQHIDLMKKDHPGLPVFLLGHSMVSTLHYPYSVDS